jgi:Predicted AAA-ATPase
LGRRQKQTAIDLETLIEFFLCCKSNQEYTEFQFFTGIMRIQTLNLGSGSNYLKDVTMSKKYATLLGFTEEEIKQYFPTRLKALSDRLSCTETQTIENLEGIIADINFRRTQPKAFTILFLLLMRLKIKK